MEPREVAVIGAGIAGLAVATALAQRGARVHVFERARALEPVGAGLQISPNGAVVLRALGVQVPALESTAVVLRDYRLGRPVLRLDLARSGPQPFLLCHRADLIFALEQSARAAGVKLQFGQTGLPGAYGGDLVIGADGGRSAMRPVLNGPAEPFFTKQTAWRAIIADSGPPEAHVYMGPGRHLVTYPLTQGRRNIVAVQERDTWAEEGWDHTDDPANLRRAFAGFSPEVRRMLDQVAQVKLWGLFRHPVAPTWQDGRHVLIGDAAHPTLPFLAQGANLALEERWALAASLERYPQPEALSRFQARRKPRVTRAITSANANARNYHLTNPFVRAAAHTALRVSGLIAPGMALQRFQWLYGHDVTRDARLGRAEERRGSDRRASLGRVKGGNNRAKVSSL